MTIELSQLLFIGTYGHVRAVDKHTGQQVWDAKLPKSFGQLVTLLFEDQVLFAGVHGRLFALEPATGRVVWSSELPGLGYGFMTLATTRAAAGRVEQAAATAAAASTTQTAVPIVTS